MCIKTGIKIRVTPEQSKKIQEICFENGIGWYSGKIIKHLDKPYLYIDTHKLITYGTIFQERVFVEAKYEEIPAEFFIKTNGTCVESESTTESIPSEEIQPKTLSEYLKENNAYVSFVEIYVEYFLQHKDYYIGTDFFSIVDVAINNISIHKNSKHDVNYWYNLYIEQPKNIVYDMNDIILKEVDRRIAEQKVEQKVEPEFITDEEFKELLEQKATKRYMVFIEGKEELNKIYTDLEKAETEAKRLSTKEIGLKVSIVEIIKEYKSEVVLNELPK